VETDALRGFISEHALDRLKDRDPLTAVRRLSETIYDAFDYEPGVTDAESPIDLALSARRGKTFLGVSVRLNVSKSAITKVATGQSRSRRIEAALAETAGIPLQELWK
jgi:hypothetical protein